MGASERALNLLIVGMATGAISMTVTKAVIFRSLRLRVKDVRFLGKVLSCPYCFSHWVAPFWWIQAWGLWDFLGLTFATVALSAMTCGLIYEGVSRLPEAD